MWAGIEKSRQSIEGQEIMSINLDNLKNISNFAGLTAPRAAVVSDDNYLYISDATTVTRYGLIA